MGPVKVRGHLQLCPEYLYFKNFATLKAIFESDFFESEKRVGN